MAVGIAERVKSRVNHCSGEGNALSRVCGIFADADIVLTVIFGVRIIRLVVVCVYGQNACFAVAVRPGGICRRLKFGIAVGVG